MNPRAQLPSVIAAAVLLGACSSNQDRAVRYEPVRDRAGAATTIELLAERQAITPAPRMLDLALRLIDPGFAAPVPGTSASTRANEPLVSVLTRIDTDPGPPLVRDASMNREAARLYARARRARNEGDHETSIALALRAVSLDPGSPELVLALADSYADARQRESAIATYAKASELGDTSDRALVWSAIGAGNDTERAIELAATVWTRTDEPDSAAHIVSGIVLGRALLSDGSTAAGAQVLAQTLDQFTPATLRDLYWRQELIELSARRAELWTRAGDANLTLQRPELALRQYRRASELTERTPPALIVRTAAAMIGSGQPALGIIELVDTWSSDPGTMGVASQSWCAVLGSDARTAPLIQQAIETRVLDGSLARSVRARLLTHLIGAIQAPTDAARALSNADPRLSRATQLSVALDHASNEAELISMVSLIAARQPALLAPLTDALSRTADDPARLISKLNESGEQGSQRAARAWTARLSIPDAVREPNTEDGEPESWPIPVLATELQLATINGDTERAAQYAQILSDRATVGDSASCSYAVGALIAANRPLMARRIAGRIDLDRTTDTTLLDLLLSTNDLLEEPHDPVAILERMLELDPYDESVYDALISLRSSEDPALVERAQRAALALTQRLPGSPLTAVLRVSELSRQGLFRESEQILLSAVSEREHTDIGLDLLVSVWNALNSSGDAQAFDRAMAWVDGRLETAPGSPALIRAKAQILSATDRSDEALAYLARTATRSRSREIERLHEAFVRTQDPARADRLAAERLAQRGGLTPRFESVELDIRRGTIPSAQTLSATPDQRLHPLQSRRLVALLSAFLQEHTDQDDRVLSLSKRAKALSITGQRAFDQIILVAFAGSESYTARSFIEQARFIDTQPGSTTDTATIGAQALIRAGRTDDVLILLTELSVRDGKLIERRLVDLITLLGREGTADDAISTTETLASLDLAPRAAQLVAASFSMDDRPQPALGPQTTEQDRARADLLYAAGVVAMFFEREREAHQMYRAAIEIDPDHAWSLNDLGYHLAESGSDLDEAHKMLTHAHELIPSAASIADSLAWVRYALGIVEDTGETIGAITLLERALTLEEGEENATIHEHLGDARWSVGDRDGALSAWLRSEDLHRGRLTELSIEENANQRAVESIRDELRLLRDKISDAEQGLEPDITRPGTPTTE